MLRLLFTLAPLVAIALPAAAEESREEARRLLEGGSERFLELIEGVSEEQWDFRVPGIAHTIGEEAEHIALSENDLQRVIQQAMKNPPNPALEEALVGKADEVRTFLLGEGKAAENFRSPEKIVNQDELMEFYPAAHAKLMRLFDSADKLEQHARRHPSPKIGELNALQWFYYIAYHRERHMQQIEAIKAHPDFPGNVQTANR